MNDKLTSEVNKLISEVAKSVNAESSHRIFTIVGPNGSGKSRLLLEISKYLTEAGVTSFHLPASRQAALSIDPPASNMHFNSGDLPSALRELIDALTWGKQDNRVTFNSALGAILKLAIQVDDGNINAYKEALYAQKHIDQSVNPVHPKSILEEIQEKLERILGYKVSIQNKYPINRRSPHTMSIQLSSGDLNFDASELSDGEKQVLLISILLMSTGADRFVFVVDEPELHLNEARAIEIWEAVERNFLSSIFVYATHSIGFATRPLASKKYFMAEGRELIELNSSEVIPAKIITEMAGSRIQIISTDRPIIFCEDSMMKKTLMDLLGNEYQITPVGNCRDVINAVIGERFWQRIRSADTKFCGVIDRDTRNTEDCLKLKKQKIIAWPVYDSESILLTPELATWFLGIYKGSDISGTDYNSWLCGAASRKKYAMYELLAGQAARISLPTIEYKAGDWTIVQKDEAKIKIYLDEQKSALTQAISKRNANEILKIYRGKDLYTELAKFGAKEFGTAIQRDPAEQYEGIRSLKGFEEKLETISWVSQFRSDIQAALEQPPIVTFREHASL